jgi:GTPase SAR1 family protein
VSFIEEWNSIYERRLNWAYRAKDEWVKNVKDEFNRFLLDDRSQEKNDIIVTLYGEPQVGKTTLLLKLLGIREEEFTSIYDALRGSDKSLGSATSTATIYVAWEDSFFGIKRPDKNIQKFHNAEEIKKELEKIRTEVEEGDYNNLDYISIYFPNSVVDSHKNEHLSIRIIDLPGIGSSNIVESDHVSAILKKYLSIANLTLIVFRIDQLESVSFLLNEGERTGLTNWKYNKDDFRFIASYALSPDSIEKYTENINEKETFVSYLKKEFKKGDGISDDMVQRFYAFDYGDSWNERDNSIKEKFESWLKQLETDLIEKINQSATEESRLRALSKRYKAIELRANDETNIFEENSKKLTESIKKSKKAISRACLKNRF